MRDPNTPTDPGGGPGDDPDREPQATDAGRASRERPYEVGYGKPPREHRFQPGQSGNPRGRPRGSRNLATALREALSQRFPVREGGKTRKRSATDIIVQQLVRKAMAGDLRSAQLLLQFSREEAAKAGSTPPLEALSAEDEAILMDFLKRNGAAAGKTDEA